MSDAGMIAAGGVEALVCVMPMRGATLLVISTCAGLLSSVEAAPKTVLFLNSYNFAFPATSNAANGARKRLLDRSPQKIELEAENLDLARFTAPSHKLQLARFLRDRYTNFVPDVLMAIGAEALSFVIEYREDFAPSIPVVFLGISKEALSVAKLPPDVTGHVIDLDRNLNKTLTLAEQLQPNARDLFIIAGSGLIDRRWQTVARKVLESRERKLNTTYLFNLPYDELIAKISRVPKSAIVVILTIFSDSTGQKFIPGEAAQGLIEASSAPVYSPYPQIGSVKGVIGGYSESYEAMGRTAADIALEILAGKRPDSILPRTSPEAGYWVDNSSMQNWNLREDMLPLGTSLLFKQASVWELYRWYIVGAIALVATLMLLIVGLIVQRSRRMKAEAANRINERALSASHKELRHLASRLINAHDEERRHIARELHDDVGQRIASLSIGLSSMKRHFPELPDFVRGELSQLQRQTMSLAEDMRNLSHDLHYGSFEHLELGDVLREQCEEVRRGSNVSMSLEVADRWMVEVADDIKLCLYRIAQEALRNIVKHSHARSGCISITQESGQVIMRIADDGSGFDLGNCARLNGLGLLSMRERARMLGGNFAITTSPNAGTVTIVCIPLGRLQ